MKERYYQFAGIEIAISMPEDRIYEREYRLSPFRVPEVTKPHRYQFDLIDSLPEPQGPCIAMQGGYRVYQEGNCRVRYIGSVQKTWKNAYICARHEGKDHRILLKASEYPGRIGTHTVLDSLEAEHLIVQNGGVIFHCSYIDRNGKAVLFTAPSETGKSTQAELWNQFRGAQIINGDRAAVRVVDGNVIAEGIPFAGSSQYCENRSLPVEAIVYLGQAPVTTIRKLRGYEAFSRIWEGISVNTWDRKDLELASDTVKYIAETVPVYHMPCTPDEDAVIVLEQELRKLESV